ncbi:hypothetical protein FRC17_002193 [Serendipita sp. 399]|nr:hypothetical protein FRC17_002193 [Serendipita sp. 399]
MSDNGRRVGSPIPSSITQNANGSAVGSALGGRNRAASTSKSVFSVKSNKTTTSYQLSGSKKINTAPPWARHEPPSPDGELPITNPVHHFLGTGNVVMPGDSQPYLSPNPPNDTGSPHRDESSRTSSFRGRQGASDVASMASSAPDQLSEQNRDGQAGWWPFPLTSIPNAIRKNLSTQGPAASLTSPFQSLFSQPWLGTGKEPSEKVEGAGAAQSSRDSINSSARATATVTGGVDSEESPPRSKVLGKDKPRVQWLFDRAQVRKQGWLTDDELRQQGGNRNPPPADEENEEVADSDHEDENGNHAPSHRRPRGMHLAIPRRNKGPFTVANTKTPGWDQPWAPLPPKRARVRAERGTKEGVDSDPLNDALGDIEGNEDEADPSGKSSKIKREKRRQTLRRWILFNNSVPLLIRLLNISFTSATLAVAISIRGVEHRHNLVGAVGSSPILAIIFAPLTLIHVMIAIYLEYFGKPLGLWRTSGKLFHTLLEMLFICMWSASLSLTFDNYFTSRLGCAPSWTTKWWNRLPMVPEDLAQGRYEGGPADTICEEQLALICLVFFGLMLYCGSLIISLFRIFEKVKSRPDPFSGRRGFGMGGLGSFGSRLGRV